MTIPETLAKLKDSYSTLHKTVIIPYICSLYPDKIIELFDIKMLFRAMTFQWKTTLTQL